MNLDTVELLKECNAGIKMGVSAIDDVVDDVRDDKLKKILIDSKKRHQELGSETHKLLNEFDEPGKEPNIMAKGMSHLKTEFMMSMERDDKTVADLITDGCNMGVKSLNRYLNKYESADEKSKDIAKKLINLEQELALDVRSYL